MAGFQPSELEVIRSSRRISETSERCIRFAAQGIFEPFIQAKKPRLLINSNNPAHLENGTNEQIVSHLERDLELNGLEAPDKLQINTMLQQVRQENPENQLFTTAKSQVTTETSTVNTN